MMRQCSGASWPWPRRRVPKGARRWRRVAVLAGAVLALSAAPQPATAQAAPSTPASPTEASRAERITRAVDLPRLWRPDQHLYVKGNLGVSPDRLDELEAWLDQNAKHWTVVLIESASDEQYTDASGQRFTGLDAVEHALGKGLPNQTAFGQWTDPRTGERDGAFFILFLRERKFSYYASDAQTRRGLGSDRWAGQLDAPAIAAMRSGGRIVDAAKDTITHVDRSLTERLAAEQADRARREADAKAERERTVAQASAALQSATEAVDLLDREVKAFQREQPQLTGDVARPDVVKLRADLAAAQSAQAAGNFPAVRALAETARQRAQIGVRALADYRQARTTLEDAARNLAQVASQDRYHAAETHLRTGRDLLTRARQAHERADSAYADLLASAQREVQAAATQVRMAAQHAALRRQATLAGAGLGTVALLALGIFLNRRRRPSRRDALGLVSAWAKALDEKTVALFALLERTRVIVGASAAAATERFAGRTLELSQQIIHDVDELIIMSACAQRVLVEARALATPGGSAARLKNLVAAGAYRAAIRRLRDEPIVFAPEEGLELIVRGPKSERDSLLGSLESYQPFQLSFEELIAAFNQRAERALTNLDQVASCLSTFGSALEGVQQSVQTVRAAEPELHAGAEPDGCFRLRPLFHDLVPSAEAAATEAAQAAIRDPVGAMQTHGARAQQQAEDASALVQLALTFQRQHRPGLQERLTRLAQVPLRTDWANTAVQALSARADELAGKALRGSAAPDITGLAAEVTRLVERAGQTLALDQARRETAQPRLDRLAEVIATARAELAEPLGLAPERLLREAGRDPSERLAHAQEQINGAKAALERGDVPSAQAALDAVRTLTDEATQLVEETRKAAAAHATTLAARRQETERLQRSLPEHERILVDIESACVPSVLRLGAGDPTHPQANGTIQDNLQEARGHLTAAGQRTERAEQQYRAAQILDAADLLREAAAHQEEAAFRLQEITEKQARIRKTESDNDARVAQLAARVRDLSAPVNDRRTMAPTLKAYEAAQQQLANAERVRAATPRDPFGVADQLAAVEVALNKVADLARCDWDVHAEAQRSLQAAAAQLEVARRLSLEAGSDSIQDSAAIQHAARTADALAALLAQAQSAFSTPHGDWGEVDAAADRVAAEAGQAAATLRGELQAAQAAVSAMSAAASQVRSAGAWTGGWGVAILGAPGSALLTQARAHLERGDYDQAGRLAEAARQAAVTAVAAAEAEMRRRRRAEEERRERERREREAAEARRRSSFGGSSFGGSGHSGFSSGSGVSHSSFSSGSGVGRSGW